MNKVFIAALLVTSVGLGGCAGLTQANLASTVAAAEATVQADASLACGFIPTIATIAAFIPGVGVVAADAATIAGDICKAVAAAPPVVTQSARLRSVAANVPVTVGTVKLPSGKTVTIVGTYTH